MWAVLSAEHVHVEARQLRRGCKSPNRSWFDLFVYCYLCDVLSDLDFVNWISERMDLQKGAE